MQEVLAPNQKFQRDTEEVKHQNIAIKETISKEWENVKTVVIFLNYGLCEENTKLYGKNKVLKKTK